MFFQPGIYTLYTLDMNYPKFDADLEPTTSLSAEATMTLVWIVENQDAAAKWFRVTPKLFEHRDGAIEWCNTLRERWVESGPRRRLRIRLLTANKPKRRRRRRE